MSERIVEFMNETVNLLFNSLYIAILVTIYRYAIYNPQNDLFNTIDELKSNQDKLFQVIFKLRNIIRFDGELTSKQTIQLKKIKKELCIINNILDTKSKTNVKNTNTNNDSRQLESEIDNTIEINNDNNTHLPLILHKQEHITFPNYFIFNGTNLKKNKLSNNNHKLEFIGDDIRLISNELARFLKIEIGSCIEFNEVYEKVYNHIQEKQIINIGEDSSLCKLFGINENGDYEFSDTTLIVILKHLLEPHLKNIINK